ncbi:hypothetical protein D9M70_593160 [compost metagenome]
MDGFEGGNEGVAQRGFFLVEGYAEIDLRLEFDRQGIEHVTGLPLQDRNGKVRPDHRIDTTGGKSEVLVAAVGIGDELGRLLAFGGAGGGHQVDQTLRIAALDVAERNAAAATHLAGDALGIALGDHEH